MVGADVLKLAISVAVVSDRGTQTKRAVRRCCDKRQSINSVDEYLERDREKSMK